MNMELPVSSSTPHSTSRHTDVNESFSSPASSIESPPPRNLDLSCASSNSSDVQQRLSSSSSDEFLSTHEYGNTPKRRRRTWIVQVGHHIK